MSAVAARGLVKDFGGTRAVDGLDLRVPVGSFYGIAGPNGAGKTTTIRMLVGLLAPDEGSVEVDGIPVWPDPTEAKGRLGLVPDHPVLFDRLSGLEMLEFAGLLRRMDPVVIRSRSRDLLRVLDLEDAADRRIADYSLGMTKRIGLAVAVLHSPRVLVLDEPFGALDPVNTQVIEEMLQRYRAGGGTVVFSSHVMDVIERLCDRLAVIESGRVRAEGTVRELAGGRTLQEAFVDLVGGRTLAEDDLSWLSSSSD
ncbi:ABC transporter ATP-binding protein [Cellulomonas soli]|uniref:ABC transporter ATP-binding protein n=1 Tax=Cellulomonas soli TaxID=931535 RepID=A0A512PHN2_9CELL|nr:ABC transporter ATP-binding protein [Cellulomonas soli]NYI59191.1 ABC-2 type transport system ATP-binding protein [Cellulomonas soli]GEP70696.1 ABC transporter ATP-binding protein [Cellulomonas soli]